MKFSLIVIFISIVVPFNIIDGESSFQIRCKKTDPSYQSCMLTNLLKFVPETLKGIPEYNIPKSDPIDVPYMVFNRSYSEHTNIIAILKNLRMQGYSTHTIHNIKLTSLESMSGEIEFTFPNINITMEHFFGGRLLSVPLGIEGAFKGNFSELFTHIKVAFKSVVKGTQKYFVTDKLTMSDHIRDGRIQMTSKNPAAQPFTNFINNFVNSNPRPVLDIYSPLYLEPTANTLRLIVDRALAIVPADRLFSD